MLPISFLGEQGDRLAGLCDQPALGSRYRNLFVASVWIYSLHAYGALMREQLGAEVARSIWMRQRDLFEETESGTGQSIESAFMLIDDALQMGSFGPGETDAALQVSAETRVALALLLGMPESPVYASSVSERAEKIRTLEAGVERDLGRRLLHARNELLAACSGLFE